MFRTKLLLTATVLGVLTSNTLAAPPLKLHPVPNEHLHKEIQQTSNHKTAKDADAGSHGIAKGNLIQDFKGPMVPDATLKGGSVAKGNLVQDFKGPMVPDATLKGGSVAKGNIVQDFKGPMATAGSGNVATAAPWHAKNTAGANAHTTTTGSGTTPGVSASSTTGPNTLHGTMTGTAISNPSMPWNSHNHWQWKHWKSHDGSGLLADALATLGNLGQNLGQGGGIGGGDSGGSGGGSSGGGGDVGSSGGGTSPANVGSGDSSPVVPVSTPGSAPTDPSSPPATPVSTSPAPASPAPAGDSSTQADTPNSQPIYGVVLLKNPLPNSAAAVSKLKANDVILSLGGLRIEKPEDLAVAGKKYAGQQVVAKCLDGDTGEARTVAVTPDADGGFGGEFQQVRIN